jgi:DNA polymerase elongation subunit (family B)
VITKSLSKGYGKVSKSGEVVMSEGDYKNTNSPHVTLANKMRERDIGSAPLVGDRMNYVFVNLPGNPSAKLYEKVELLEVVQRDGLEIDYTYYVKNQLKNPCCEILRPMVPDIDKTFDEFLAPRLAAKKREIADAKIKAKIPKGQMSILKWFKPTDK